ncbi:unnamed protein product [Absidia cylindrospora]
MDIREKDDVFVPGLEDSVVTYLKTIAMKKSGTYMNEQEGEKYFIMCGMNNIVDLTDDTQGSQRRTMWSHTSTMQPNSPIVTLWIPVLNLFAIMWVTY